MVYRNLPRPTARDAHPPASTVRRRRRWHLGRDRDPSRGARRPS